LIKEGLKGHHQDNQEVSDELMYWFFAHSFGFTPEQVDNLPYDRMTHMTELEVEFNKQNQKSMNNGGI